MVVSSGRKPAVGFIFFTVMFSVIGFGLLIPVLPGLVIKLQGEGTAAGSYTYGWIISIYAIMQFIGSPLLGALSDRFGRRRIILIATAGSAIDYAIMAWAPNLIWFFIARTIAGFTAGVLSTANAYIADVTTPEKRAQAFGIIGAAFGLGFAVGPTIGGLLGSVDIRLPFIVASGIATLNFVYGFFVLPESLAVENRRAFSWTRANPIGALLTLKRFPAVLSLTQSYFFLMLAQSMIYTTWALYTGHRYAWGPGTIGLSLTATGVVSGYVQGRLIKKIVPRLGETKSVVIGFSLSAVSLVCYGLAPYGWMIFVILCIGALGGISSPALQSYITKHVPPNEQGTVQGVFASLQSLAGIPGPFLATHSFGWAIAPQRTVSIPGIAFFEAAALTLVALFLAVRTFRKDAHATIAVTPGAN